MRLQPIMLFSNALLFVTAALSGLTLVAFVLLAVFIFQGRVETKLLYSIAVEAHVGGFTLVPILIGAGAVLAALCKRAQIPIRITGKYIKNK